MREEDQTYAFWSGKLEGELRSLLSAWPAHTDETWFRAMDVVAAFEDWYTKRGQAA